MQNSTYRLSIIINQGSFNRFDSSSMPCVGDEIAIVNGNGDEDLIKVTQIRRRAYRCGIDIAPYCHESDAIVWADRNR